MVMTVSQIAAPDLTSVAIGGATLQLLDGLGFSEDGKTLLIRATYLDDGDGSNSLHYGVWSYDIPTQCYTACLNTIIAGAGGSASDIDINAASLAGSGNQVTIVTQSVSRSQPTDTRLGVITNGTLVDSNLVASSLSQPVLPFIERFALSNDGRFVAIQTSSPMLAPDNAPDTNDTSDIYLIDRLSMSISRVSYVGGSEVNQPVYLGNVFVDGATVQVSFTTDAAFVSTKIDQNSLPGGSSTPGAQTDAWLWSSAFDGAGLAGNATFRLLSIGTDGLASGFAESGSTLQATSGGAFFSGSASNLVSNDTNAAIDSFLATLSQNPGRIALNGMTELAQGATLLGASSSGRYVALLSSSPELAGSANIQQMVVTDLQSGSWRVVSMNGSTLANDMIIGGVLSPNGALAAFTTAADNLDAAPLHATYGLFVATTGFGATTPLTVSSFSPADAAFGVAISSDISLSFSDPIQRGTGTIAIHAGSPNGTVVESFDAATSSHLLISGTTLAINPTVDLAPGTHYFVTFADGVVKGVAGSSYPGTGTYDFTTEVATTLHHRVTGSVHFWKSALAVTGVTSSLSLIPSPAGTLPVEFRNEQTAADGTRTIEIWESSVKSDINALQLEFALPAGAVATWQESSGLPSGWTSVANSVAPGKFILAGSGVTALSAGSVKLGTLSLTASTTPKHFELLLRSGWLGSDAIAATGIATDSMTTDIDALYQHSDMIDGTYTLTSAKVSGVAEGNALQSSDALAALKIAVGLNPNADGSAVSPYQFLAADVNKDGAIKAGDALGILKMVVKLTTAPANEWLFVPDSVGSEAMSRTHVVWPENPIPVTLDVDQDLHLIGIVKGDVDGSWVG